MNKPLSRLSVATVAVASALSFNSCVDHDYDLTKENIDLKVTLGGELLTIPSSSLQEITLSQILDLDSESSIKEIKAGEETKYGTGFKIGDYVLVQDGNSEPADFDVEKVEIAEMAPNTNRTVLDPFIGAPMGIIENESTTTNTVDLKNDNVPEELVELDEAELDVCITFSLAMESNDFEKTAYIKQGYQAVFNEAWTVEPADAASAQVLTQISNNVLEFAHDYPVTATKPFSASVRLTKVDFTNPAIGAGQGLYDENGVKKFRLENDVNSKGYVYINSDDLPVGEEANITLVTSTEVAKGAEIISVTGIVDPEIDIEPTSFTISDIPDFLSNDENSLDIENPRITFTVTNDSPLSLEVNGKLTAYIDRDATSSADIGEQYGTKPIIVPPSATTVFTISRVAINAADPYNIVVPELGDIIKTIPDEIRFHSISCKAIQEPATYALGHKYSFTAEYQAIIPLAFGPDMTLHYTEDQTGWDSDLEKYNFKEVDVTFTALNTLPLEMVPSAIALDRNGNEIPTIKAVVTGTVAPSADGNAVSSDIKIVLTSDGENIGALDGVRIVFDATAGGVSGVNLNSAQSLILNDICVQIRGGVTIDLND